MPPEFTQQAEQTPDRNNPRPRYQPAPQGILHLLAGGLLLRNDRNLRLLVGERIHIAFNAPDLAPAFAMDARIVRVIEPTSKPGLLAAMWTTTDATATAALGQILWNLRKS